MVVAHSDDDGPAVATLTIPALSTIWLRHEGEPHVPTISHG
jgi:1,4-alpha-glucan branching enzyme